MENETTAVDAGTPIVEVEAPPDMAQVRAYYVAQRADLVRRTTEIEHFLGFAESVEDLGTRLGKIERFLKIKRG